MTIENDNVHSYVIFRSLCVVAELLGTQTIIIIHIVLLNIILRWRLGSRFENIRSHGKNAI